jgi:hypothetical protein
MTYFLKSTSKLTIQISLKISTHRKKNTGIIFYLKITSNHVCEETPNFRPLLTGVRYSEVALCYKN